MSYQLLERRLDLRKELPIVQDWSAAADFLGVISNHCLVHKPQTIVECSSGASSIVLAQCCMINDCGHVYSLENGEEYVLQTRQYLDEFCLSGYCDVIHAPLQQWSLIHEVFQWYELNSFPDIKIDMLVIDGPPGSLQKHSRFPALPLLEDKLADDGVIFLDDAARDDEQEVVKHWLAMYPEFRHEYIDNERGCSILTR
ncbi:MAG: class I SAM-dependent methyltransferase [Gammaproteobacteria bacterium]|nr:class I SAM-dependent methyltransferase [Gammaproteobacteria bacterium]